MSNILARLHAERGQILVMAVLLLTVLLGLVGLAVDAGFHYAERRQVQNAADQAALAAAWELNLGGTTAAATAAALENANGNGFDNNGTSNTVTVNIPPTSGDHIGDPNYVEAIITEDPQTFFIHVLTSTSGVSARGVATYTISSADAYAMFVGSTDCATPDPPLGLPGSNFTVTGGVHSNSNIVVGGSNNTFNAPVTYVCTMDNSGTNNTYTPAYTTAPSQPLPLTYSYSDFPCTMTFIGNIDLTNVPAAWVGGDKDSGQLIDGVYCATGKLTLSASNVTANVTLAAQGPINISGSHFTLTPFWNDVLFFTEDSSESAMDLSGSNGSWEGIMLAPNGRVKIAGSNNITISGSIMADQIETSGSNWSLTAVDYNLGAQATVILVE